MITNLKNLSGAFFYTLPIRKISSLVFVKQGAFRVSKYQYARKCLNLKLPAVLSSRRGQLTRLQKIISKLSLTGWPR